MRRSTRRPCYVSWVLSAALASSCSSPASPPRLGVSPLASSSVAPPLEASEGPLEGTALPASPPSAAPPSSPKNDPFVVEDSVNERLRSVAELRELSIRAPIRSAHLDRDEVKRRMREKIDQDVPPEAIEHQAESLRGFELIPVDYDLKAGFLRLLGGRVSGYYDPDDDVMVLVAGMTPSQEEETLDHELVHALQDQTIELAELLDYHPGESDRSTAVQLFIEGDATFSGLRSVYGALPISPERVKAGFESATLSSPEAEGTPPILLASLTAPYTLGYALAYELHAAGGMDALTDVLRRMPTTTEQALHVDKWRSKEPPMPMPMIPAPSGFEVVLDDQNGELGLRLMAEVWGSKTSAPRVGAGWGGDRLVVVKSSGGEGTRYGVALRTRMETRADANDVAQVFRKRWGSQCKERAALGPVAWEQRGEDILLVAGPYERIGSDAKSRSDCSALRGWMKQIWSEPAPIR